MIEITQARKELNEARRAVYQAKRKVDRAIIRRADRITEKVCAYFGVSVSDMKNNRRGGDRLVAARHWSAWFILKQTKAPLEMVAKILKRDNHTTIMHARDTINDQLRFKKSGYVADYEMLSIAISSRDDVPVITKPKKKRKVYPKKHVVEDVKEQPIIRPKAVYTNTNYSEELEKKAKEYAI